MIEIGVGNGDNSVEYIIIKDFLPQHAGNTIIVPSEIVAKSGADFDIDKLSKMALADPSTGGNPKKLTINDMKIMYQHSMTGELFK